MLITLITFLFTLSILVLVHEFGHFIVAKKTGIKVEEFGLGLPPRIWGKKIGETIYSLNWLPIGGFVKLAGEERDAERESERAREQEGVEFWAKPKKVRTAVLVAGVTMNFLLAMIIFSVIYTKIGIPTATDRVKIIGLALGSPAEQAGFKTGDIVVSVGGEKIDSDKKFISITQKYAGRSMSVEIFRDKDNPGENLVINVVPRQLPPQGEGPLGVAISQTEMKFYPWWQMPFRSAVQGSKEAFGWARLILQGLGQMVSQLVTRGVIPSDIAGPIGIFQVSGEAAKTGIMGIFNFIAILSVNLAVLNIMPFPALDGGRLLFVGIEAVIGKRGNGRVERIANTMGMSILLFMIFLVTLNDIGRIIRTSDLILRLKSLLPF